MTRIHLVLDAVVNSPLLRYISAVSRTSLATIVPLPLRIMVTLVPMNCRKPLIIDQ